MNTPDIVAVTNLSKHYGTFIAVNDISFSIRRGEIFGFLGPNGAGKTTTLNMVIGLARPSGGSILIDGIDAVKNVEKAQSIMGISNGANLAPQEIRMDFAVLPAASLYFLYCRTAK